MKLSNIMYKSEIADLCKGYKKVFWIPGNHEYYIFTHSYAATRYEQPIKEITKSLFGGQHTERIGRTQLIPMYDVGVISVRRMPPKSSMV